MKTIYLILIEALVLYLFTSFIKWEFNPSLWEEAERFMTVFLLIVSALMTPFIQLIIKNTNEKEN